jgi:hypothetical protein
MWPFKKRPIYEDAFHDCKTPEEVCAVVRRWVVPLEHSGSRYDDLKVHAISTWNQGYGDCDDIAYLIYDACLTNKIPCDVTFYWPMNRVREGHALATGIWESRMWCADNGEYIVDTDPHLIAAVALNCTRTWSRRMT